MDKQLDTNNNITNKLPLPKVIKAIFVSRVQCATLYRVAHWIPRNRLTFDHEELRPKTTWVTTSRWSGKRGSTGGIRIKWTEDFGAGEGGFWRLNKWDLVTRCSKPCLLFLEGNDILPYVLGDFSKGHEIKKTYEPIRISMVQVVPGFVWKLLKLILWVCGNKNSRPVELGQRIFFLLVGLGWTNLLDRRSFEGSGFLENIMVLTLGGHFSLPLPRDVWFLVS